MAFASEFEYQDELEELELLDFEDAPVDWKTRDWFQFHRFEDGHFEVRVSGFGLGADRPILKEAPKGGVLKAHQGAVNKIVNEIKKIFVRGACVNIVVSGYVDPQSESRYAEKISDNRAKFFFSRIWEKLLGDWARVKEHDASGSGLLGSGLWSSKTSLERMLNRRVHVYVYPMRC
jgi:hypothetical protein